MLNTIIANHSLSESLVIRTLKDANKRPLKVINPSIGTRRLPENQSQAKQPNLLKLEKTAKSNSRIEVADVSRLSSSRSDFNASNRLNTRQRFTLSADQSIRLSRIGGEGSQKKASINAAINNSINQYLETQNLQRREEIETLVGFDLFV